MHRITHARKVVRLWDVNVPITSLLLKMETKTKNKDPTKRKKRASERILRRKVEKILQP